MFDVAFISSGPASFSGAVKLKELNSSLSIAIFEKGENRKFGDKNVTSGIGGAGAFSDGKLNLTSLVGGQLGELLGRKEFERIMEYVKNMYLKFGAEDDVKNVKEKDVNLLKQRASDKGLTLVSYPLLHFGTDNAFYIVKNIFSFLESQEVEIYKNTPVVDVIPKDDYWQIQTDEKTYLAKNIVIAVGREGEDWWVELDKRLGLRVYRNPIDKGFRVEVANEVLQEWTDVVPDFKLRFMSSQREMVRTFCCCPAGFVTMEEYRGGLLTTNGHSYKKRQSPNTNFAILSTTHFKSSFNDPVGYGRKISGIANDLAGGNSVLVQTLFDIKRNHRSYQEDIRSAGIEPTLKKARAGNLGRVMPYTDMINIKEMWAHLVELVPALEKNNGNDTLWYGIEIKFYSAATKLTKDFESERPGLYLAGDITSITRGLMQSSMTGVMVAEAIAKRI